MIRMYLCMVMMGLLVLFLEKTIHFDKIGLVNNIFRDLFIGALFMAAIDEFKSFHLNNTLSHKYFGWLVKVWYIGNLRSVLLIGATIVKLLVC